MQIPDWFSSWTDSTLLLPLLGATLGFVLALWLRIRMERWWGRIRQKRGTKREMEARHWLEQEGFQVIECHPQLDFSLEVNGETRHFIITPDFLVRLDDQIFVVEVKAGRRDHALEQASVRRQVIEYMLASGLPCLLLDMPNEKLDVIEALPAPGVTPPD